MESRWPTYPPYGPWDARLAGQEVCPSLQPVTVLHENEWFVVRNRGGYFTAEPREPQLVVLPVVERDHIVLVRVIRPVLDDATFELPAGGFHPAQETPFQGAARELAEETGIVIEDLDRFKPLPSLAVSPNRIPRLVHLFQVDLSWAEFDQRRPHDHEICSVHCLPLPEVARMILKGEIYVTMPVALIGRYWIARAMVGAEQDGRA
ncbi:MAG: NUDIX hydrolase [Magnetococcales bacterium]|nr:NUDIX hydrolase [Magnetococcales bacterium]